MTLQGVQQAGTGSNNASQGTVTSPTSLAVGDLILVQLNLRGSMDSGNITSPSGYSLKEQVHGAGDWHANVNIYYKIAVQADVDATDITFSWTTDRRWRLAAGRVAAGEFDPDNIFGNTVSAADATDATSFSLSSINVTEGNLVIGCFGVSDLDQNQQSTVDPAIFTTEHANIDAGSSAGLVLTLSSYTPNSDGTTGTAEWTWTNTGNPSATIFEINAANDFEITSPLDQATDVPDPFDFEVSNPNEAQGFYKQISKTAPDGNDDLSDLEKDIVATNVATSIAGLDPDTYHLKAIELLTLGGQSTEALFFDDYNRADAAGWGDDYTSTVNSGTASKFIESNEGVIEIDPSSRFLIDVAAPSAQDFDMTWEFENQNVSTDYQPTLHFAVQGDYNASGRIHSYWVFFNGNSIELGRTNSSYNNQVFKSDTFSRTANTKYKVRALKIGFDLKIAIWPSSGSQDGWLLEHEDTTEISSEGTLAIIIATTSGSTSGQRMTFSLIDYKLAAEAPEITNIDVTPDSATISFSTVPFDNEGYEYQYREVGESFGAWTNIGTTSPFDITSLASGDYEVQMSAMHNGQRSPVSEIKTFTIAEAGVSNMVISPANPELEDEAGKTVKLTRTLDSTGGATKSTTWSITQQPANGSISIKSQTSEECTIEAGSGLVISNDWKVKAVADYDGLTEDEVTGTVVEATQLVIDGSKAEDEATLSAIYSETGGSNWANNSGWSANVDLDTDTLYGVETETIGGEVRVVSLNLSGNTNWQSGREREVAENGPDGGNNLVNTIENINWSLGQCVYINLKNNFLTGGLPSTLISKNLKWLRLQEGTRTGTYEADHSSIIARATGKEGDSWATNTFTGPIPESPADADLEYIECRGRRSSNTDAGLDGKVPNSLNNTKLKTIDLQYNRFTDLPDNSDGLTLTHCRFSGIRINPDTGHRWSRGMGMSKIDNFFSGHPDLRDVGVGDFEAGIGTSDNAFPEFDGSDSITTIDVKRNGIGSSPAAKFFDGTHPGLFGTLGLTNLIMEINPDMGPLPEPNSNINYGPGGDYHTTRATNRWGGCNMGGEFYPEYFFWQVIIFDIDGNGFTNQNTNWLKTQDIWLTSRLRNFQIRGNNFTNAYLPLFDFWSTRRQPNGEHALEDLTRIRISDAGVIDLTWQVPKQPFEISSKAARWYYDNKTTSGLLSNVNQNFTISQYLNIYSRSFIDSHWDGYSSDSDSGYPFMQALMGEIFNGWNAKDF